MSVEESTQEKPNTGRMYDYFLHGKDNGPVDRAAGDEVMRLFGEDNTRGVVRENRAFQGRVVAHLVGELGITQFIDVGSALPTVDHTHHVAGRINPDVRVLYAEADGEVVTIGQQILADEGARNTRLIEADMRNPLEILDHPDTKSLIDFSKPVAVMFIAALHCIGDFKVAKDIVAAFEQRMAPGSYLVVSHLCTDQVTAEELAKMDEVYKNATFPLVYRSLADISAFFDGFELQSPGLVPVGRWRPGAEEGESMKRMYGGYARK
ncbi:SAM-dependent methyltransferase [Catellatospora tritici]|uniref:SAM-dependent methyltransferase n=1 Tax=Catellatospora tritici TaxID=2851566 RepID=UPI001C2DB60A|nr:SAM-dependent methyltransferase [Catellatospora tritici]MBV1849373.1 SAM-dependent methyltransferase [Catellatospora tritici]